MVNWALQPDKKDGDGALTDMDYPVYPPSLYRCPPHISFSCLPLHSPAAVSPDVLEHTTCIQRCKLGGPPESDRDRCVPRPIRSELVKAALPAGTSGGGRARGPVSHPGPNPPWTEPVARPAVGEEIASHLRGHLKRARQRERCPRGSRLIQTFDREPQVHKLRQHSGGAHLHHGEWHSGGPRRPQAQGVDRRLPQHGAHLRHTAPPPATVKFCLHFIGRWRAKVATTLWLAQIVATVLFQHVCYF